MKENKEKKKKKETDDRYINRYTGRQIQTDTYNIETKRDRKECFLSSLAFW